MKLKNTFVFMNGFLRCEKIYSAGNDSYLYVHDIATTSMLHRFKADEPIYNVTTNVSQFLVKACCFTSVVSLTPGIG